MLNKTKITILLISSIVVLSIFLSWRWLFVSKLELQTIPIDFNEHTIENPLDKLIQKHLYQIAVNGNLLKQFLQPAYQVQLQQIAVQQCEVTQGSFRRFSHWRALQITEQIKHPTQPKNWEYKSQTQDHEFLGQLTVPAGGLSFYDAYSYCGAVGGRLLESIEFQAIASNQDFALYPWGSEFNSSAWQYRDPTLNVVQQCSSQNQHQTKSGIYGLGTNVSEWTTNRGRPQLMGGNAYQRPYEIFALNLITRPAPADFRSDYTGFRCVFDASRATKSNRPQVTTPWGEKLDVVIEQPRSVKIGIDPKAKLPALFKHLETFNIKTLESFKIASESEQLAVSAAEITVAQYQQFLSDPLIWLGFYNHENQPEQMSHRPANWKQQLQNPSRPVTNISWWSAWTFANWLGGRLPTAFEWQHIASANITVFPYGNSYQFMRSIDRNRLASHWNPLDVAESNDANINGVVGLTGNVSEWTNTTVIRGRTFNIVVKGGSFYTPQDAGRVEYSAEAPPDYQSDDLGFRVVFD